MEKVSINEMSDAIINNLTEYSTLVTESMKDCVMEASKTVKSEIKNTAPERTGAYKKSWAIKKKSEDSNSMVMVVHSKNRYQIAHLLEHGHAKRNGGRVAAIPHIAPAEEKGIELLTQGIERGLST